jgi:hypothetical protein
MLKRSISFKKEVTVHGARSQRATFADDCEIEEIDETAIGSASSSHPAAVDQGWRTASRRGTETSGRTPSLTTTRRDTGSLSRVNMRSSDISRTSSGRDGPPRLQRSESMSTQQIGKVLEARQNAQRVQDKLDANFLRELEWNSAVRIQAWFRMMRYAKSGPLALVFRKNQLRRKHAAIKLQRVIRGHRARHDPDLELRIEIRRLEHCCAIMIQSVTRGHQKRSMVRKMIHDIKTTRMFRACVRVQSFARGWVERRRQAHEKFALMVRIRAIETFVEKYFKPWQKRQHKLFDENLHRLVVVQSKVRRFIAIKHARERRKTKKDFAVMGAWLCLYAVALALFVHATVSERNNGAAADFLHSVDHHLLPHPLPYPARSPETIILMSQAAAAHAAAARARAADNAVAAAATQTPAPSSPSSSTPASSSAPPPPPAASPAPFSAANTSASKEAVERATAPRMAQISQPVHVWDWLEAGLLPQMRLVNAVKECSVVDANLRSCGAPRTPGAAGRGTQFQPDGFPGTVAAALQVRQQRAERRRYVLPYARTQDMYDRCLFSKLGAGHICANVPPGYDTGLWETADYGHARPLQADTIWDYLQQSRNYTFYAYQPARSTVDAAGAFLEPLSGIAAASAGARGVFGSTYVNFSFTSGDGLVGTTVGLLATYPGSGYDLGEAANPVAQANASSSTSSASASSPGGPYAHQKLNLMDPSATTCGAPCQSGLRGLALAEWLDSATRSVVVTTSVLSLPLNVLVCVKAVVEFGVGGGAVISRQLTASRLMPYVGGGLPEGSSGYQMGARVAPEVLFLLFGLGQMVVLLFFVSYNIKIEKKMRRQPVGNAASAANANKDGRYRFHMIKREGKFAHRLRATFAHGWGACDIVTSVLVLLAVLARLAASAAAENLVAKIARGAEAADGERRGVTYGESSTLVMLQGVSDSLLALVAIPLWGRGIFKYIPTVRWMQAPAVAVVRLLQPLMAMAVVSSFALMGAAHVGVLLFGAHVRRFSSFQHALGTIVTEMLRFHDLTSADEAPMFLDARVARGHGQWRTAQEILSRESMARATRGGGWAGVASGRRVGGAGMDGWGGGTWGVRGSGREEEAWFLDCVRVCALVVGAWAAAAALQALKEEMRRAFHGASRPWLYAGTRRTDYYSHWHVPPLMELGKFLLSALRSPEAEQAELQRCIVQMRVLTHIRGQGEARAKVGFSWAILLDEDTQAMEERFQRRELSKVSRALAIGKRHFFARCEHLEASMLRVSEEMMDGLELLFQKDFVHSAIEWPRAQLAYSDLEKATKKVAAETEDDKKVSARGAGPAHGDALLFVLASLHACLHMRRDPLRAHCACAALVCASMPGWRPICVSISVPTSVDGSVLQSCGVWSTGEG